ncbi:MAG: hypothetical protein QOJ03_732 [Frankiaceae bacterium]|jgi:hypothetical protein|nr:hypothetical protein [Frankiaceae bacterium]
MLVLGLLLMLGCAALAVDAAIQNTAVIHAIAFNRSISDLSVGALFIAGTVVGLLFALGLAMFFGGLGRARRARRERRALRRDSGQAEELRAENARLEQELLDERSSIGPGDAYPGDRASTTSGRHRVGR